MSKIYLASSWRNTEQPAVLAELRSKGHEVYDFKHKGSGFSWSEIDTSWQTWTAEQYIKALSTPRAVKGFQNDYNAMRWADVGLLLLPCGRSAHLELGWMAGVGKFTIILTKDGEEPELMALLANKVCTTLKEVLALLK